MRPATGAAAGLHGRILRQHDDAGADGDAAEQVADVFIGQPDASRRNELADRAGIIGAVNAILAGAQVHRARSKGITGPTGHEAWQIGLACNHLSRRMPVWPLRLARHGLHPRPSEALAADTDAVAKRTAIAEDVVKVGMAGIDDDRASRLAGIEGHGGAAEAIRQRTVFFRRRIVDRLVIGESTRLNRSITKRLSLGG